MLTKKYFIDTKDFLLDKKVAKTILKIISYILYDS